MSDRYTIIVDEMDGKYDIYDNGELWWTVTDRESGDDLCGRLNKLEAENAKLRKALEDVRVFVNTVNDAEFIVEQIDTALSLCTGSETGTPDPTASG